MNEPPASPPQATPPPSGESKAPEGGLKILLYLVSLLVPLAGIIIGVIFYTKDSPEEKQFGKMCIILAVASIILSVLCGIISFLVGIATFITQLPY